jgi:hypothetical protein
LTLVLRYRADFKLITPKRFLFVIQETQRVICILKEEMMQLAELVKNTICFLIALKFIENLLMTEMFIIL